MSYRQFSIAYDDWKTLRTDLTATGYYVTFETRYKLITIDIPRENIYLTSVNRLEANANLVDFETNLQPGFTSVDKFDEAVALEIPIGGVNVISDADDDDVADSLTRPTTITLGYAYDTGNTRWERLNQTGGSLDVDVKASVLPTGAATEVTLSAIDTSLDVSLSTRASEATVATLLTTSAFQARINTLGQKLSVASTPVVLASDQSAIPVSQSGTWNVNNITGTVSLPTGAATQTTLALLLRESTFDAKDFATETTLASLNGKVTAVDTGNVTIGAALPAGGNNIGDVDVASLPVAAGGTETLVRIAFGSVPAAYGAGAQLVTTAVRNHILVRNDTDGDILLSLAGATDNFKILSNEVAAFDGVTIASAATVRIKQDGGAPTDGEVTLSAWSDR